MYFRIIVIPYVLGVPRISISGFRILENKERPIPWGIIFKGINSSLLDGYVSRFREQTKKVRQDCVILPQRGDRFTCQICKQNILDYKFQLAEFLT